MATRIISGVSSRLKTIDFLSTTVLKMNIEPTLPQMSRTKENMLLSSLNNRMYKLPTIESSRGFGPLILPSLLKNDIEKLTPSLFRIEPKLDPILPGSKNDVIMPGALVPEKQAARLIVIRRAKMRKHKRKKWLKLNKFNHIKHKLKKATEKERLFNEELFYQLDEAESFDARQFVEEYLDRLDYLRTLKLKVDNAPRYVFTAPPWWKPKNHRIAAQWEWQKENADNKMP